jgi:hypothetical protein
MKKHPRGESVGKEIRSTPGKFDSMFPVVGHIATTAYIMGIGTPVGALWVFGGVDD